MAKKTSGLATLLSVVGFATAANAAIAPLPLPGNATNVMAGNFASRNDRVNGGGDYGVWLNTCDGDITTYGVSGGSVPDYYGVFNTPAHGWTNGVPDTLTPYGAMTMIRVYAYNNAPDTWYQDPQSITVKTDGLFTGNDTDANSLWPDNWPAVVATVANPVWTPTGLATGYDYIDIPVDIPAGSVNAVFFDFGTSGPGGHVIAEIQAVAVPEPVSMGILGIVAAGLLVRRRNAQ